jgi:hypothetical protein
MTTHPATSAATGVAPARAPAEASRLAVGSGLLAGGLLAVVPALVELVGDGFFVLLPVALLAMLVALPGLRRHQDGRDGHAGKLGVAMVNLGLLGAVLVMVAGSLVLDSLSARAQDSLEPLLMGTAAAGAVAAAVGLVLLTVGMLRARLYPAPAVVAFGPGLVLALVAETWEQTLTGPVPLLLDVLPPTFFTLTGLGLIGIALAARAASPVGGTPNGPAADRH